jgi:hypothetical protein
MLESVETWISKAVGKPVPVKSIKSLRENRITFPMFWLDPKSIVAHSVADADGWETDDQPFLPFTPPSTLPLVMKLGSHLTPSTSVELTDTVAPNARLLFTVAD